MGRFVNPDNSAFQVALNSEIYVDKTGLLSYTNKVLDTMQGYICNSRPRRFGKSITANMLTAYYSKGCSSKEMFSGLEISRAKDFEKHLNQYDVLHWDIQWCMEPAGGPERIVSYISEKTISELKEYYPHILPEEIRSLPEALSRINAASGTKFIVIIDEWDVLIRDEAADLKTQEEYINFLRAMFKGTEPTKYIQLAYLTGILPVKKEKTQSALNNFKDYSMLYAGPIAPYVGFTETEVQKLCEVYGQKFEEVKRWYDGYQIGKYHVYNPNAVVNLMLEGEFQSYWSGTASYEAIVPLINMDFDGLRTAIIEMLSGVSVEVDVSSFQNDMTSFVNKDDVFTYLIHLGYLANKETSVHDRKSVHLMRKDKKLKIRTATMDDLEMIAAVEAECFPAAEAATREEFAKRLQHYSDHFWLMFEGEKLIAFVDGFVTDEADLTDEMYEKAELHNEYGAWQMIFGVNTIPACRRHGYAGELICRAIQDAKKQGRKGLVLTCKDRLVPYYAKFGFVNEGVSDSAHGNVVWNQMRLTF